MHTPFSLAFESPDQPDVVALIEALDAYQAPLYPAESNHLLDIASLMQPQVRFAVARDAKGAAVGCGAAVLMDGYAELKRMFVPPPQRGQGIAKALLQCLEAAALDSGRRLMTLETGISQPEALGLYERAGYERCGPFGNYRDDPLSVFMRKRLGAQDQTR